MFHSFYFSYMKSDSCCDASVAMCQLYEIGQVLLCVI